MFQDKEQINFIESNLYLELTFFTFKRENQLMGYVPFYLFYKKNLVRRYKQGSNQYYREIHARGLGGIL